MSTYFKLISIGLVTVLLCAGLVYEFMLLSRTEREIVASVEASDAKIGSDARSRSIMNLQANSKADLAILEEAVLTKADLVTLIGNLEKTGRDLGLTVSITSVTSDATKTSSTTPQTVKVAIEATGKWAPSLNFVRLLENLPHKAAIEKVELGKLNDLWRVSSVIRLTTLPER